MLAENVEGKRESRNQVSTSKKQMHSNKQLQERRRHSIIMRSIYRAERESKRAA